MCDFSLQSVRSRPAKVGDKLVTHDFGTGTRGFAAADDLGLAVCVMPGTELAFAIKKKRPPTTAARKAPRKAPRKPPRKVVEVPAVEDTIIDVIDEPVPGVIRVIPTLRMIDRRLPSRGGRWT